MQATFDLLELCVEHKVEKVVAASSASVYGMAEEFPTTERHHPYDNRTLYGAAKVFNEGLLRSFNDMYGLDYVAFRYFNVYGAAHGHPWPLHRGADPLDGAARSRPAADHLRRRPADDGLRPRSRRRARQHPRRQGRRRRRSVQRRERHRDQPAAARAGARSVMGRRDIDAGIRAGALGQSGAAPPGLDRARPSACSASGPRCPLETGLARSRGMVAGRARPIAGGGQQRRSPRDPDRQAAPRRGRGRGGARRGPVRLGHAGPEVAAFEREFAALVGAPHACAVSNCTTALHLALLALGVGPGDEVITVSHSFIATANAIRYCGATPVFVDIEPRHATTSIPSASPRRSRRARAPSSPSTRSACPATSPALRRHGRPPRPRP